MEDKKGRLHPLSLTVISIGKIFSEMGFDIAEGPETETEHYNFDALNIPKDHPARDMWDTFWLKSKIQIPNTEEERVLLRTHTSPMQVRYMEKHKPPIMVVVLGKCYRHEATDATHEAEFYQVEGLVVDENISVAHLKGTLDELFKKLFEKQVETRFRPSYFPFVEPGFETDVSCFKCNGKGCQTCKETGWIEMGGSGLVHPKVLEGVGIDSKKFSGFAFGFGIDRLTMLKYDIPDVRLVHSGDLRLNQF